MAGLQVLFRVLVCAAAALLANGALTELDLALLPQRPGPTTRGTEFIFAFMGNDEMQSPIDQDALIIITTEEPDPVVVTVEVNPAFYVNNPNLNATAFPRIRRQTVARGSSITFPFPVAPITPGDPPPDQDIRVYTIEDARDRNSGIRISTDGGEVSVYGLNNELSSVDAFSVFPCREYPAIVGNYEYVILSAEREARDSRLMIVGCQNNTAVTITPPSQLPSISPSVPPNFGGGPTPQTPRPSQPLTITDLDQLQSILLNNQQDLSGTRISSTRPIAVFTGHECGNIPIPSVGTCDHLIQQVPPQVTWGRLFFTVPIVGRYSGDHYRVATVTRNTEFTVTCRTLTDPTPTNRSIPIGFNDQTNTGFEVFNTNVGTTSGDRASRKDDLQWCCIESNNPVLVMQYAQGLTADMNLKDVDASTFGDPLMTIVPPVVQYLNDYTVPTEKGLRESRLDVGFTIAIPQDDTFFRSPAEDGSRILLNDEAIIPDPDEGWIGIYCASGEICGYSARVEHAPDGVITIRHVDPRAAVSAWVYGIAGAVSFGFTAGFKLDAVAFPIVSAEDVTVMEVDGTAVVTFTRTGDLSFGSRFNIAVVPGTATSPADYNPTYVANPTNAIRRTFSPTTTELVMRTNIATVTATFDITVDTIPEGRECFFLNLEATRRAFILTPVVSVCILDLPISVMCVDPVNPVNGVVTINGNSIGDTATYACNPGFEIIGTETVTCTQVDMDTAEFQPAPPVCRPLCPDPVDIVNGVVTFIGNSVGETATYTCNSGFELFGDPTTTCTQVDMDTAEFQPAPPVCRPLCPDPVDIVNGVVTFTGNSVGETATYTCNSGFELFGDPTTTCTLVDVNTAEFQPAPPVCRPLCPDPVDIVNGVVTFIGNSVGETATYTCNSGFELFGDPTTTCTQVDMDTAEFQPAPPVCRPLCPDPVDIVNGVVTFTGNSVGETATYTCNSGFELFGDPTTTCTLVDVNTAEFQPAPPVCRPLCPDPVDIVNGVVTFTGNSVGETATYTCNSGFELIGDPTTTCTLVDVNTAEFQPAPPVCRPLCPDPVDIVNGVVTFIGNSVGETATYTCNSGFELIGDPTTTCTQVDVNTAEFSPAPPVCRPLCPDPVDIVNGVVTFTGNSVGETATYTCNSGFELIGDPTTTCTRVDVNTAEFQPAPPVCRPLCPDPVDIVNGVVTFTGISVGETATYDCDPGFELIGDPTTTCTQVDVNTAEFSPAPPVCRPLCPDPVDIVNGVVTFTGNSVGETATYSCNSGFELIGDPTTTCTRVDVNTAEFQPAPPVCRPLCPDPVDIVNGMVTFTGNSVGETATYTCNSGFELIGDPTTTCTRVDVNTAEFQPAPPVCRPLCPDPVDIVNGMVTFTGNSVDDTATYTCDPGFNLFGDPTTTCTQVDANSASFQPAPPVCSAILIQIGFDPTFYAVSEDAGSVTLRITKTGDNVQAVSVDFSTQSDSAVEGEDFEDTSQTVTFGPSDTEMFVTVPIFNDDVLEMTESFFGILTNAVGMNVMIVEPTAVVNITDDDRVQVGFDPTEYAVAESEGVVNLIVRKFTESAIPVTVVFNTMDGTASAPGDYIARSGVSVTFQPSEDTQTVPVTINQDGRVEILEIFFGRLQAQAGDTTVMVTRDTADVEITDSDVVVIGFEPTVYTVTEGTNTSLEICAIVMSGTLDRNAIVMFSTSNGAATTEDPSDYEATVQEFVFGPGIDRLCATVPIVNDDIFEGTENFFASLTTSDSAVALSPDQAEVTILEDPNDGCEIGFDPATYEVDEGDSVTLTVVKGCVAEIPVSVTVNTMDGTAVAPGDYTAVVNMVITFQPDSSTFSFEVQTAPDVIVENTETFTAVLSNPSPGGVTIGQGTASVDILEGNMPTVTFTSPNYEVLENNGTATVCVRKDLEVVGSFDVDITSREIVPRQAEGSVDPNTADFQIVTRTVTFTGDQEVACTGIPITDDTKDESREDFEVFLEAPSNVIEGDPSVATVTIIDDDVTSIEFDSPDYTVNEDNGTVTVCLTTNRGTATALVVDVVASVKPSSSNPASTADFVPATRTITFPVSTTASRVCTSFQITDDTIALEGNEQFRVDFTAPAGTQTGVIDTACVTIVDDDDVFINFEGDIPPGALGPTYVVPEDNGTVTVCLSTSTGTARDIVIEVTPEEKSVANAATAGEDFIVATRTIVYPASLDGTTRCTSFDIVDDDIALEGTETFRVVYNIVSPPGAMRGPVSEAWVDIIDNDDVEIEFEVPNYTVPENNGSVFVCLRTNTGTAQSISIGVRASEKTTGDIATAGEDFVPGIQDITFPPSPTGSRVCTSFEIIDDDLALENPEQFNVDFIFPSNVSPGGNSEAWVTITDDDEVEVEFSSPMYTVNEGNGTVTICLTTDSGIAQPLPVDVIPGQKTTGNIATAIDDFETVPRRVIFPIAVAGGISCTTIGIVDDEIAQEGDETFNVAFNLPVNPPGSVAGPISEAWVIIIDNDNVSVGFETIDMTVNEADGTIMVCLTKDRDTDGPFTVSVTVAEESGVDNPASDLEDFLSVVKNITFQPTERRACGTVAIIDDSNPEDPEPFAVTFEVPGDMGGVIIPPTTATAEITIIDDDGVPEILICTVFDPLMVSPFERDQSYSFMGTCEHTLVTSCTEAVDFAVTVDFLPGNFANGEIGVRYMDRRFVVQDDRSVDARGEVPINSDGDTDEYEGDVFVTITDDTTTLDFQSVGVAVVVIGDQFHVNVTNSSSLGELCGLCGTRDGSLLYRDLMSVANINNATEVRAFANSWLVPANEQFLRDIRRECAQLVNDTIIGDPLYTVPFTKRGDSLCYEVHGSPDQNYNLVSDVCTNVNAFYNDAIAMDSEGSFEANFIQMVGVRAVGSSSVCQNIRVFEDENGVCSAMRMGAPDVFPLGTSELDGIIVRRVRNRVRISVPNCEQVSLVMWITCEERSGVRSLRFDISRGLNLRPTSHGLIGQFWNIPVSYTTFNGTLSDDYASADIRLVTVRPPNSPVRMFLAERFGRTWTNDPGPCFYAGNGQGGPYGGVGPDDSVIQGRYTDYQVDGLFATEFIYQEFEDVRCLPSAV